MSLGFETTTFSTGLAISVASLVLLVCLLRAFRASAVAALLVAGIAAGPYGLGIVDEREHVHVLVELGALLFFFHAGTRFRFASFDRVRGTMAWVAGSVCLIAVVTFGVATALTLNWRDSLFIGFLAAAGGLAPLTQSGRDPSSRFPRRRRMENPVVVIAQCALVAAMILLIPIVAGVEHAAADLATSGFMLVGFGALALLFAPTLIPDQFSRASRKHGATGALSFVLMLCSIVVLILALLEINIAIGALTAGVVLSHCRYQGRPISEIGPVRPLALAVFCIGLGMLLDFGFMGAYWKYVLLVTALLLGLKTVVFIAGSMLRRTSAASASANMLVPIAESSFLIYYAGSAVELSPLGLGMVGEHGLVAVAALALVAYPLSSKTIRSISERRSRNDAAGDESQSRPFWRSRETAVTTAHDRAASASDCRSFTAAPRSSRSLKNVFDYHDFVEDPCSESRARLRMVAVQRGALACYVTLSDISLRERLGVSIIAFWRGDVFYSNPRPSHILMPDDRVLLSGTPTRLAISARYFRRTPSSEQSNEP